MRDLDDPRDGGVHPLIEAILERVPPPQADPGAPFRMLVSNIDWDDYVGRIALGKVESGEVKRGDVLWLLRKDGTRTRSTITKVFEYAKLGTRDAGVGEAGNIVGLAGFEDVDIGETLAAGEQAEALPFVAIDPPTVQMQFAVNDGPFAGGTARMSLRGRSGIACNGR